MCVSEIVGPAQRRPTTRLLGAHHDETSPAEGDVQPAPHRRLPQGCPSPCGEFLQHRDSCGHPLRHTRAPAQGEGQGYLLHNAANRLHCQIKLDRASSKMVRTGRKDILSPQSCETQGVGWFPAERTYNSGSNCSHYHGTNLATSFKMAVQHPPT